VRIAARAKECQQGDQLKVRKEMRPTHALLHALVPEGAAVSHRCYWRERTRLRLGRRDGSVMASRSSLRAHARHGRRGNGSLRS
jgi:hypothetical protein